MSISMVNWLDE